MPEPQKPNPVGWPRISSSLYYEDPHRAIEWLCNGFGFQLRLKVEGEAGEVVHSELTYGDGVIMVSSRRRDPEKGSQTCNPNIRHPGAVGGANTQNLMVYVDDLEAHHARAVQHGAKVTSPIALHDYGEEHWADRSYGAMDPDGHHWWFCERMRDPGKPAK